MSIGVFITGTDTEVGKTFVATALLRAAAHRGLRAAGMKPVASGATHGQNADALALRAAGNVTLPDAWLNPYCFDAPIAPHLAARDAGVTIGLASIRRAYEQIAAISDWVVVEGAGGWLTPITATTSMQDIAIAINLPVVMVVRMRLGCLNHALLTAATILNSGLPFAGWIANSFGAPMERRNDNVAALRERLSAPLLAEFGGNDLAADHAFRLLHGNS